MDACCLTAATCSSPLSATPLKTACQPHTQPHKPEGQSDRDHKLLCAAPQGPTPSSTLATLRGLKTRQAGPGAPRVEQPPVRGMFAEHLGRDAAAGPRETLVGRRYSMDELQEGIAEVVGSLIGKQVERHEPLFEAGYAGSSAGVSGAAAGSVVVVSSLTRGALPRDCNSWTFSPKSDLLQPEGIINFVTPIRLKERSLARA